MTFRPVPDCSHMGTVKKYDNGENHWEQLLIVQGLALNGLHYMLAHILWYQDILVDVPRHQVTLICHISCITMYTTDKWLKQLGTSMTTETNA